MPTSYTSADVATLEAAILQAGIDGIASCTVAGQSVTNKTADELEKILSLVERRIADSATTGIQGRMRALKTKPQGAG
jgi:hypothetical protein